MEGKVKWFDPDKYFGFIQPVNGGSDVFVHMSALRASKIDVMEFTTGQPVNFEITTDNRGKEVASNIRILDV